MRATAVSYVDNTDVLDMCLGVPIGLLSLLDEESRFPAASDASFMDKIDKNLPETPAGQRFARVGARAEKRFTVQHYAESVM